MRSYAGPIRLIGYSTEETNRTFKLLILRANVNTILILCLGLLWGVSTFYTQKRTVIQIDKLESKIDSLSRQVDSLNLMHPWKKSKKSSECTIGTEIGKYIFGGYRMNKVLYLAMQEYGGPDVSINSCYRHWNHKSAHHHGKAIDIKPCDDVLA